MRTVLPPLAGLAGFEHAAQPGLSVEACVARLKRLRHGLWRLHQICTAHVTAEPLYELKMAFSLHAHLCAENDTDFRARIGEMREPPLGLEKLPHPALGVFFDEIPGTPWPELYQEWCEKCGLTPDPDALAYDGKRADLKEVAVST